MKLIIFDADGTLIDRESGEWLPSVLEKVSQIGDGVQLAIATNQGGPACHDAGWPWSDNFPTLSETERRYTAVAEKIGATLYMALAYQSKKGDWYLPRGMHENDPRVNRNWRKPHGGMLFAAMKEAGALPNETLFVGDSKEDEMAAEVAGVRFEWASEFFK